MATEKSEELIPKIILFSPFSIGVHGFISNFIFNDLKANFLKQGYDL